MPDLSVLRRRIRGQRRSLLEQERHSAEQAIVKTTTSLAVFTAATHIAGYLAFDGEFNPAPLIQLAWSRGKKVYLPVLIAKGQPMLFAPYRVDGELASNGFGILEPVVDQNELIAPDRLELVLTPLVAFDERRTRLGVGGGFYDRSFAPSRKLSHGSRPFLLGLAYELQKVLDLPRREWDVPLDAVVTEAGYYSAADSCEK